jgi:hypothetical protein
MRQIPEGLIKAGPKWQGRQATRFSIDHFDAYFKINTSDRNLEIRLIPINSLFHHFLHLLRMIYGPILARLQTTLNQCLDENLNISAPNKRGFEI